MAIDDDYFGSEDFAGLFNFDEERFDSNLKFDVGTTPEQQSLQLQPVKFEKNDLFGVNHQPTFGSISDLKFEEGSTEAPQIFEHLSDFESCPIFNSYLLNNDSIFADL